MFYSLGNLVLLGWLAQTLSAVHAAHLGLILSDRKTYVYYQWRYISSLDV